MTHDHHIDHNPHGDGLHEDLVKMASRRSALKIFGATGAAAILSTLAPAGALAAAKVSTVVPTETAGPYPGDGSNGPDALTESGIVRHDIRRSFGDSTTLATGVPLRVNLTVLDSSNGYAPLSGAAVYLWHCNRLGEYSMYASDLQDENYLRGIAQTNSDGTAWFKTIFPACYSGRWPHIHFEVYSSVAKAVANGPIVKTSQMALPQTICKKVYASSLYPNSTSNLSKVSLATDMVFSDDRAIHQIPTVTGSVKHGFVANLTVGV